MALIRLINVINRSHVQWVRSAAKECRLRRYGEGTNTRRGRSCSLQLSFGRLRVTRLESGRNGRTIESVLSVPGSCGHAMRLQMSVTAGWLRPSLVLRSTSSYGTHVTRNACACSSGMACGLRVCGFNRQRRVFVLITCCQLAPMCRFQERAVSAERITQSTSTLCQIVATRCGVIANASPDPFLTNGEAH